jgi:nicotinamidase/pyrazinamidase
MDALLVVDLQIDFCPGGALEVPEGDRIVPRVNRLMEAAELVVLTQDWHPPEHGSFAINHDGYEIGDRVTLDGLDQILWPAHCVRGHDGARFHPDLDLVPAAAILRKGTEPRIDSYSAFYDNGHRKSTGLSGYLREQGVQRVCVCGLAADVCVKFTALDARREDFRTVVLRDATRGVNLQPGDTERAFETMAEAGVELRESDQIFDLAD